MSSMNKLRFIKKQLENDDIYTFYFTRPEGLSHKAGQHGLFILPGFYRPHPFTISSSPGEEYVTISTHVDTGSRYKRKLMNLKDGDSILLLGPILNFTFRDDVRSYVFLAQGIGVTPFRSMLVHAHNEALPITTTLIHVDGKGHSFQQLTKECATKAFYPASPDVFRELVALQDASQQFYLSGSPRFVSATRKLLLQQGVKPRNISADSFLGY
ncbi:MAG: FAD-dependent oxidoreductase [Candidatus Microsaccharimonas sp.]